MVKNFIALLLIFSVFTSYGIASENSENKETTAMILMKEKEKKILEISKKWAESNDHSIIGPDGEARVLYGASIPTLICCPLKVSEIRLELGEELNDLPQIGDSTRWKISPVRCGEGANIRLSIIVKPLEANLETNLMLATNKRTYLINLKSTKNEHVPRMAFFYNDSLEKEWIVKTAQEKDENEQTKIYGKDVENLDFGYSFSGYRDWFPERAYNDGNQTIICMPSHMKNKTLPAFMVLNHAGNNQIVNYRIEKNRYIVYHVFDKAILLSGTGQDQKKVYIKKISKD